MNRAQRRAEARYSFSKRSLPHVPQATSTPSVEVCHGVCRSCSKERQLFLPARICGRCIQGAMELAQSMSKEQAQAMLAALDDMDEELADD